MSRRKHLNGKGYFLQEADCGDEEQDFFLAGGSRMIDVDQRITKAPGGALQLITTGYR
jgi:hypothetical protein